MVPRVHLKGKRGGAGRGGEKLRMEPRGVDEADGDRQRKYDEVYDEMYGGEAKRNACAAAYHLSRGEISCHRRRA